MELINTLLNRMMEYNRGDTKRIQHLVKVYSLSRLMGEMEGLDQGTQGILEMAAIMHDIGVRPSEEKFGNCAGSNQEKEGVVAAEEMFRQLTEEGFHISDATRERVCHLIGHHHTYKDMDGMDYQILVEADFLVNLYEKSAGASEIQTAFAEIFRTDAGKKLCRIMFDGMLE